MTLLHPRLCASQLEFEYWLFAALSPSRTLLTEVAAEAVERPSRPCDADEPERTERVYDDEEEDEFSGCVYEWLPLCEDGTDAPFPGGALTLAGKGGGFL